MMSAYNEPAFPAPDKSERDFGASNRDVYSGMTLRDYFAAKAMVGLLASMPDKPTSIARWSYELADAMLEKRSA